MRWSILAIAGAAMVAAAGVSAGSQPERRPQAPKAAHLHLSGDLDAMSCVEDVRVTLTEAVADGATLLVVQIDADHARPDVLVALAEVIREAEIPTVGFLVDERDGRVTTPALALALAVGDRVAVDPGTAIRFERGDWRHELMPEEVVPAESIEELRMAVQRALAAREIDPTVVNAWLPAVDEAGVEVDPRGLEAVGISVVVAETPAQVCRGAGHRGQTPRVVEIETSLSPAQSEAERLIIIADEGVEAARRALDVRNRRPDQREVTVHDHRRAGAEALERLSQAAEAVDRAEGILREYPEILLGAPPGKTDVGTTRQSLRTAWRYRLDDLREDIEYWRGRAKDSATR